VAEGQAAVAAGDGVPQSNDAEDHAETIREYANFLLHVPHYGQLVISWDQVERCVLQILYPKIPREKGAVAEKVQTMRFELTRIAPPRPKRGTLTTRSRLRELLFLRLIFIPIVRFSAHLTIQLAEQLAAQFLFLECD
jgi:hypothetical protein